MKILAIGRPRAGVDARTAIAPHADSELRMLWALYGDGFVREMHSPGRAGVVLILEAPSVREAEARLGGLPLVSSGVIEFELIELRPFTAFARFFSG